jgi:cytochrome b561
MVNPKPAYTGTAILLHWLVVALLVAQVAVAWTMPDIGRDTPQTILISLHFSLGVLILFVAVIRLLCRATQRQPESQRLVCCRGRCGRRAPSIGCSTRS